MPSVTVIITTRNRPHFLYRALASVQAQRRAAEEILVIDDGSDDVAACELSRIFPGVRYHRQRHQGISKARNTGIRLACFEWLAFLDDDDEWSPAKLAEQIDYLSAHPEARILHCDEQWLRNGVPLAQKKKHRKPQGQVFFACLPLCVISPSAVLIHRQVFNRVGLFDETLPVCEDYDMWLRVAAHYFVHCVRRPLVVKHGGHVGQLSRKYWGMDRFRIHALWRCLEEEDLSVRQHAAVRNMLMQKLAVYLRGARKHGQHLHVADFSRLLSSLEACSRLPRLPARLGSKVLPRLDPVPQHASVLRQ